MVSYKPHYLFICANTIGNIQKMLTNQINVQARGDTSP